MHTRSVILSVVLIFSFLCQSTLADTNKDHKKIQVSRNSTVLQIVQKSGVVFKGKWHMETDEALCMKIKNGHEIIISKSEISEISICTNSTNEGFFYGLISGMALTGIGSLVLDIDSENHPELLAIGTIIGSSLLGAVIGSFMPTCEPIDIDDLKFGINVDQEDCNNLCLQLSYNF